MFSTFQGKPQPAVSWTKDGQPLDTKRVNIRNTDRDSIFFIRTSERADSGVYEMCVKVDSFEDKSQITLQIIGKQKRVQGLKQRSALPFYVVTYCYLFITTCFAVKQISLSCSLWMEFWSYLKVLHSISSKL